MEYKEIIDRLIGDINSACSESYENVKSILKSDPFEPANRDDQFVFQMPKDGDVE